MKRLIKTLGVCALIASIAFSAIGCAPKNTTYSRNNIYFDTIIQVTVFEADDVDAMDACFDMASKYEQLFSRTIAESDISKINEANGEYVEVDPETITLIQAGIAYAELSDGAFDITIGALSDTWDFKNNTGTLPEESELTSALSTVGYENILIDGNRVALANPDTMLDLGAIAKGYIADQMKAYLVEHGVTSAIINLGGNVLLVGNKTDGNKFTIGVQKPFDKNGTTLAAVDISDCSLVTSGIYERYFEMNHQIYHHILDTKTGYPINNGLYSVTIISPKSVDGDALSTTIYALGLEKGMQLIEALEDVEAIFVTDTMEIITSSGINQEIPFRILK